MRACRTRKLPPPEFVTWKAVVKRGCCTRWRCLINFHMDVGPRARAGGTYSSAMPRPPSFRRLIADGVRRAGIKARALDSSYDRERDEGR